MAATRDRRRCQGKRRRKDSAAARHIAGLNLATVRLDYPAGNGQAQPGPFTPPRAIRAVETLKKVW